MLITLTYDYIFYIGSLQTKLFPHQWLDCQNSISSWPVDGNKDWCLREVRSLNRRYPNSNVVQRFSEFQWRAAIVYGTTRTESRIWATVVVMQNTPKMQLSQRHLIGLQPCDPALRPCAACARFVADDLSRRRKVRRELWTISPFDLPSSPCQVEIWILK